MTARPRHIAQPEDSAVPTPPPLPQTQSPPLAYATPPALGEASPYAWQGKFLLVPRDAVLPDRCIKCGAPGAERVTQLLHWLAPHYIVSVLGSGGLLSPLVLALRKRGQLTYSLCGRHARWKRTAFAISVASFVVGTVLFFAAWRVWSSYGQNAGVAVFLSSLGVFMFWFFWTIAVARTVAAISMTGQQMVIHGVKPAVFKT